jgi:hypothetical protein
MSLTSLNVQRDSCFWRIFTPYRVDLVPDLDRRKSASHGVDLKQGSHATCKRVVGNRTEATMEDESP